MATFLFDSTGIAGLAAAVPARVYNNLTDNPYFCAEDAQAIVEKTGIVQRRIAGPETTSADLCYAAGRQLLVAMSLPPEQVDAIILVTQTPDYRMPASSILLQDRLGLPKSCMAFDVNLGCSGFVVGLSLACSLLQQPGIRNVILMNGETRTKVYSFRDRQTGFLFGDAGTACLVTTGAQFGQALFKIDSDGSKADYIMVKSGGYRHPSTPESFIEREQEGGRFHSDEQGYMDGAGVFEFVISEVPRHVRELLQASGLDKESVDYFVFHQANKFMNGHLTKKLKLAPDKVPLCLDRFGNTSSVTIPLTIVSELRDKLSSPKTLMLSGFGVGLSLGSAVIKVDNPTIPAIVEV